MATHIQAKPETLLAQPCANPINPIETKITLSICSTFFLFTLHLSKTIPVKNNWNAACFIMQAGRAYFHYHSSYRVSPVKDRELSITPVVEEVKEKWHFNYHKEGEWGGELLKAFWILTAPLAHIYDNVDRRNETKQLGRMCMQGKWYRIKLGYHYHGIYDEAVMQAHTYLHTYINIRAQAWLSTANCQEKWTNKEE